MTAAGSESDVSEQQSDPNTGRSRASGEIRRVPKSKDHYTPTDDGLTPRDAEERWARAPGTRVGFLLVMILLVVVGVIGAVGWSLRREWRQGAQDRERVEEGRERVSELVISEAFEAAVVETVRGFQEAGTPGERSRFLIGGAKVAGKVADYYTRRGVTPPAGFGRVERIEQRFHHGVPMYSVLATEPGSSKGLLYNVIPARAEMLIEWESSVGLGEIEWGDLLVRRPNLPTQMRVYLTRDERQSQEFSGSTHVAFKVAHKTGEELRGYAPRDSPVGRELIEIVAERSRHPVNVRLHFPRETRGPVVLIDELIHNHWIDKKRLDRVLSGRS